MPRAQAPGEREGAEVRDECLDASDTPEMTDDVLRERRRPALHEDLERGGVDPEDRGDFAPQARDERRVIEPERPFVPLAPGGGAHDDLTGGGRARPLRRGEAERRRKQPVSAGDEDPAPDEGERGIREDPRRPGEGDGDDAGVRDGAQQHGELGRES